MSMGRLGILAFVVGVALVACVGPRQERSPSLPPLVRLVGATEMAPLAAEIQARARHMSPSVDVQYTPTNTETALRLLVAGKADIALASWLPKDPPQGFVAIPLGEDDVAIMVHPRAGVEALSLEALQQVFEGRHLSWEDLGGNAVPVRIVSREAGSGTRAAFEALVMRGRDVALTAVVMPSARAVVDYVARHEGAVGYASARWESRRVRVLRLDGSLPGEKGYPLHRSLYAILPKDAPAWIERLLQEFAPSSPSPSQSK